MITRFKKRFLPLILAAAAAMVLLAIGTSRGKGYGSDIVVLYTNDVHCGVEEQIGYAGLALYKKQLLSQTPYVTLIDAGDAVQGGPIGTLSRGGDVIEIMNRVGYDFAVPGNHEFDYGMGRFMELDRLLSCGYYSCNLIDLAVKAPVLPPYKLFVYGDTRVAFVGAATPESLTKSNPAYFQDSAGNYIYGFCEDDDGRALYDRIQDSVDAARREGADYVILVGHLGGQGITERWTSGQVIAHTRGIDAWIDGHSHETIVEKAVKDLDGRRVVVTQAGTKLSHIGKMTIRPDGTISTALVDAVPVRQSGGNGAGQVQGMIDRSGKAVDGEVYRFIRNAVEQYEGILQKVAGHTDYALTVHEPSSERRAVRSKETNLGDLTADAYRYMLDAEIGLSNGGGIRADLPPGDITYRQILEVFPHGNMGCVAEVTGSRIRDALEMASRSCPEANGAFLQVSGLTYVIDTSIASGVQLDDKGNFLEVRGEYRVKEIQVNGEALDLNRSYTVASNDYLLKYGGDGMTMFAACGMIRDESASDADLLSGYIERQPNGRVGPQYADPAGQGRIIVK